LLYGSGHVEMFEPSQLALFLAASLVLLATPGPAVLYIVARSLEQGRRAGIISVLGIHAGTLVHIAAAALGLSAALLTSVSAFMAVKYAGAAYLVYLGLHKLLAREVRRPQASGPRSQQSVFLQGVLVNVLNPKTALFFLAFLPQFVDVSRGSVALQILLLGTVFVVLGILCDGAWALLAGSAGNWLSRRPAFLRAERYVTGGVLVGLGLAAAFAGANQKK